MNPIVIIIMCRIMTNWHIFHIYVIALKKGGSLWELLNQIKWIVSMCHTIIFSFFYLPFRLTWSLCHVTMNTTTWTYSLFKLFLNGNGWCLIRKYHGVNFFKNFFVCSVTQVGDLGSRLDKRGLTPQVLCLVDKVGSPHLLIPFLCQWLKIENDNIVSLNLISVTFIV